jgi:uncharacterized Zn finger protein
MSFYGWSRYVPVAERRAKAVKQLDKMKKKGLQVQPVSLTGRKIAASFWGKGWCDHMESFGDYANRLPRGRTYVRNGSVCHLEIKGGQITAIVSGSTLYNVAITITPLHKNKWAAVRAACTGRIGSLIDLLRGRLNKGVMAVVADQNTGLFPLPGEMKFTCDCPDWAGMCKHVAAVLYGVGARLDHAPEMLFILRGVNHEELVDVSSALTATSKTGTSRRRIAPAGLADVFGIEMAEAGTVGSEASEITPAKAVKPDKIPATAINRVLPSATRAKAAPTMKKGRRTLSSATPFPEQLTGADISAWRLTLGETQTVFAARIGLTAASISQWEKKGTTVISMQSRTLSALRHAWELTQ